jgi:hypothetical protein
VFCLQPPGDRCTGDGALTVAFRFVIESSTVPQWNRLQTVILAHREARSVPAIARHANPNKERKLVNFSHLQHASVVR